MRCVRVCVCSAVRGPRCEPAPEGGEAVHRRPCAGGLRRLQAAHPAPLPRHLPHLGPLGALQRLTPSYCPSRRDFQPSHQSGA